MPHFTRRRLQAMLDEIAPFLNDEKARDLLNRLENKRVDQVLPAEMELGLLWALSRLGDLDIEPSWWADAKRPDAYTEHLVSGRPAAIEIAAPSDNSISGEDDMDRVARAVNEYVDTISRDLSPYLYFMFGEESGWSAGKYFRRRLVPKNFELSNQARFLILTWVECGYFNGSPLRLEEPGLLVEIHKKAYRQTRHHNTMSSMPPETHSVDGNPLYELLKRKLRQLKAAAPGTLRFIFLGDAGSTLINRLGGVSEIDPTRRRFSGREIIGHFVTENAGAIDSVVAIGPVRRTSVMGRGDLQWQVSIFNRPDFHFDTAPLKRLVQSLPRPRFEGYEARSLFKQGAYDPSASGWWLATQMRVSMGGGPMEVKISSRALIDLLAGRMTSDQFRRQMGEGSGMKNLFNEALNRGRTIQGIAFEPGGVDEDDDLLIVTLSSDPGASSLKLPKKSS